MDISSETFIGFYARYLGTNSPVARLVWVSPELPLSLSCRAAQELEEDASTKSGKPATFHPSQTQPRPPSTAGKLPTTPEDRAPDEKQAMLSDSACFLGPLPSTAPKHAV